ncbi:Hypothetical predicted protein [Octopus vulgaris]|uniref:Uncharacterized protein n=1 Tax=Octopus vulgaris TaxID=6645 RepID=A0AA36BF47_OCTVU|nr:Hypothetical predicted protein [Octopus vulgaris]
MHVLKNWELSECIENIDQVIDKARGKEILNEHEGKYVKSFKHGSYEESRKLMEMVSCYGDQLETFLDILNETGNEQLARRISEKKYEFVFMIRSKDYLNAEGRHNHCSLLPRSIPTQFIYESKVEDVIDKLKEKYECRKPIADRLYVVIVCKNLSEIFTKGNEEAEMSCLLIHMYNVFGESKEIKVIVNVNSTVSEEDRFVFLPFPLWRTIEMYIIENKKDEELKDFLCCTNIPDTLKRDSRSKITFTESYMYVFTSNASPRTLQKKLESIIEDVKIVGFKRSTVANCVELAKENMKKKEANIRGVELMSKIKRIIVFVYGLCDVEKVTELFELEKRIDIVINFKEGNKPKVSEWKKKDNVTIYAMDEKQKETFLKCPDKMISVDNFLSEYCAKIGYENEQ